MTLKETLQKTQDELKELNIAEMGDFIHQAQIAAVKAFVDELQLGVVDFVQCDAGYCSSRDAEGGFLSHKQTEGYNKAIKHTQNKINNILKEV